MAASDALWAPRSERGRENERDEQASAVMRSCGAACTVPYGRVCLFFWCNLRRIASYNPSVGKAAKVLIGAFGRGVYFKGERE